MPQLQISLLGPFNATLDDQPVTQFRTNKVQALLIYLAAERDHPHQREALMTILWPDMPLESAQVNLRQTIYRLRQAIPEIDPKSNSKPVPFLMTDRQTVQLNPEADIFVDVDAFESHIKKDPVKAIELYRGDFLVDFYLADSNPFEEWAERIRENLRRKAIQVLDALTDDCLQNQDYEGAQRFAWRQLEIDNLRESAYRQLMTALAKDGQRSAALSQYQNCTKRLEAQLGVHPSQETTNLYEQIQTDALRLTKSIPISQKIRKAEKMPVFILTDIEDSTRLWDIHHQAMLSALLQHNTILEEQINKHGGRILELRGDGVKAVFEGGDPLACTISIQKRLGLVDWGEIGELKIRIGLHGVPTVRKGYDYFQEDDKYYGPVLNHTARIMDAAWGGQILASEQVRNTYVLPDEAYWQDFSEHRVKSLDHPIHIYGLIHPDLPHQSFPPLRTLSSVEEQKETRDQTFDIIPQNLPQQATPFVGRQTELDAIISLLNQPKTKLVSIIGPGGMGKTRLALALAENKVQTCSSNLKDCKYPDGVYFIPLTSVDEPGQIIRTIMKVLNVPTDSRQSSEVLDHSAQTESMSKERLLEYLKNKRILIILDNFEHLVDGAEQVSSILEPSSGLQIIITSRERLHIREEQVYPIQGLEYPEFEASKDPCDYTAIELFVKSAQRLLPNFQLSSDDMTYLIQICHLVGGMPLGLELAASWIDMLSIKDIAEEIRKSLDFLETDVRNIPDRHRSIRAVFDTSWNRLTEVEKQIFSRFSMLRGGFSRSAAQEIAGASIRNLAAFVSKTLLHYDKVTDTYQIHELLRQYGEEHLNKTPDEVYQTQQRHSAYYCKGVKEYLDTVMAGNSHIAFDRINADIDNISRAWNWAIQHENIVSVDYAINGLSLYYANAWGSGDGLRINADAVEMLSKYIQHPSPETDQTLSHRLYAKSLAWLGFFTFPFDIEGAQEYLDQSQEIINGLIEAGVDARHEKALLFFLSGIHNLDLGKHPIAKEYAKNCLSISKEIGFDWMVLSAIDLLGDIGNSSGSPREAKFWYEKFLAEAKARNNLSNEIRALHKLGLATRKMMAYDEAQYYYREAISLAKSYNNPMEETYAQQSLGFLSLFLGDFKEAIQHFQGVVSISENLGVPQRALNAMVHIGFSNWMQADFIQADSIFKKVLDQTKNKDENTRVFPIIFDAEYRVMH
ncbi:MAG: BTAD domain-containing putative transcriptional regulator, partial [Anaerolineales bacterium]